MLATYPSSSNIQRYFLRRHITRYSQRRQQERSRDECWDRMRCGGGQHPAGFDAAFLSRQPRVGLARRSGESPYVWRSVDQLLPPNSTIWGPVNGGVEKRCCVHYRWNLTISDYRRCFSVDFRHWLLLTYYIYICSFISPEYSSMTTKKNKKQI